MNARIMIGMAGLLLVCSSGAGGAYGPPVIETEGEFFVYGLFDTDALPDYLVIDRASGGMRQLKALSGGGLLPEETRASGLTDITGVAVGRFTLADQDTIAVTSPLANRVRVCGPSGAHFDGWPSGVGPRHVTAVELPGGSAGRSDLVATTELNATGKFGPYRQSFMLNQVLLFSGILTRFPPVAPESPLAVRFDDGAPLLYGEMSEVSRELEFTVYDTTDAAVPALTSCSGIALGSRVVYGNLVTTNTTSEFVFHAPGSGKIQLSSIELGQLTAPVTRDLAAAADRVQPVEGGGGLWLAAVTRGGRELHLYTFGTSDVPQLRQQIVAPTGRSWTAVVPAAGGRWYAASSAGGEPSSSFRRFDYDGGKVPFRGAGDYDLEPLYADELGSDVLLFAGRPFFDPDAVLRGRYRAGGWTSKLNDNPEFPSSMDGYFEVWRGAEKGLGNLVYRYLGIRPAGVTHGLANQIAPDQSFYSLDSPIGGVPDLVTFDPEGGPQTTGIEVQLSADDDTTTIYYTLGSDNQWFVYLDGNPITVTRDTTIRAYASNGVTKSPIQSEVYAFPSYAGDVDSDGDQVPDLVEKTHGLDPLASGLDGDGDGVSDLAELLAGTDPADKTATPDPATIRSYTRHFDIRVEPLSHSGVPQGEPLTLVPSVDPGQGKIRAATGTWVNVNRPDGTLEHGKVARGDIFGDPPVKLTELNRIVENPPLFWVAGTPNRFHIDLTGEPDRLRGRGVFRLLDYEAPDLYPLPQPDLTGTDTEQSAQWVAAMRDHFSSGAKVEVGGRVSWIETVDLLLAEHALGAIFHARGLIPEPKLTLTPFRGDAANGRHPLEEQWLAELPAAGHGDDGYDWGALLSYLRADKLPKGPPRVPLDELAGELYRIGFRAHDDPDSPLNLTPFDALREFIDSGRLHSDYAKLLTVPAAVVDGALTYRDAFAERLPERSYTAAPLTLVAGSSFFQDPWIVLRHESSGAGYWLADERGQPMGQPLGFRILPDCRFQVTGHPSARPGGGTLLMVDSITLVDVPLPGSTDVDRNVLADNWEAFYYGILGNDPFGDPDGDGYMTLQEMFENTDPVYRPDFPALAALDLRLPPLDFVHLGNLQFDLSWHWPTTYQHRVRFYTEGSPNLENYQILLDDIPSTNGDLFQTAVDGNGVGNYFFRVGLGLR